jgi:putative GTP pyrophosphokinase
MIEQERKVLKEFKSLHTSLNKWGRMVDRYLLKVLNDPYVINYQIKIKPKFRLKANDSYLEKAIYRNKGYTNHLEDIEDKIGTRIVLLKSSDVIKVSKILLKQKFWKVKKTKDTFDYAEEDAALFDYQSIHLVCIPPAKSKAFSAKHIPFLSCEIQIRTLLQHAFAEISHDSTYKGVYKHDKEMVRKLAKSMALMEATDDYFCNVFLMMANKKRYYSNYLNELIKHYKKFVPTFSEKTLDYKLSDSIFDLLQVKKIDVDRIGVFAQKNKSDIQMALRKVDSYISKQPVVLILLYFIINFPNQLRETEKFSDEIIKVYTNAIGISFDGD